jgi:tetratricopeptide (TPR) repeat protein
MMTTSMYRLSRAAIVASCCLFIQTTYAEQNKTVFGASNLDIADGATEFLAGNAEEGVRLTLIGLNHAQGRTERVTGYSNLCAGYFMLDQLDIALTYCDKAIEENDEHWRALNNRALIYVTLKRYPEAEQDILRGQQLAPNSNTLKIVKSMLLDATYPVSPNIIMDERRRPPPEDDDE